MFAVLQFPIADVRSFVEHRYTPLRGPHFPEPSLTYPPSYLMAFGPVDKRRLRADPYWQDEWAYCRANRALRFPLEPDLNLPLTARKPAPRVQFKRLYSNGNLVNRVEVGFDLNELQAASDVADWARIFRAVLVAEAGVRVLRPPQDQQMVSTPEFAEGPLAKQGFRLARLYADATSCQDLSFDRRMEWAHVEAGQPMFVAECDAEQFAAFASRAQVVETREFAGLSLAWALIKPFADQEVVVWMIGYESGTSRQRIRALRISLLRLHAARQCLDSFIRQWSARPIAYSPGTELGQRIDRVLLDAVRAVGKPVAVKVAERATAVGEAFSAMSQASGADQLARLEQHLDGVRSQVAMKVVDYQRAKEIEASRPIDLRRYNVYREGDIQVTNNGDNVIMQVSQEGGTMENVSIQVNKANADKVDSKALGDALEALAAAIMESDSSKKLDAVTAVGKAKEEGTAKPDKVVEQIAKTGKILTETNTTIEQGKKLWNSVKLVADVLAPIVGTAALIGKLFGLAL